MFRFHTHSYEVISCPVCIARLVYSIGNTFIYICFSLSLSVSLRFHFVVFQMNSILLLGTE